MSREFINLPIWAVTYLDHASNANIAMVKCSDKNDAELYVFNFHNAKEVKSIVCAS